MRIAVAEIAQETDSFSPLRADLKDFDAYGLYLGRGLIRVDSPGTTQSDLTAFRWKRLPRPIHPLDTLTDWRA